MHHMVGKAAWGMRYGVLVVTGILLVGGCSGTTSETTTTTAPPTTSTTSTTTSTTAAPPPTTTTTLAPTTTVDPLARPDVLVSDFDREAVEDFDTTGDDLYRITLELLDLFNYFESNPTVDASGMVSLMFERDYPHWNSIMASFVELAENPGWHYVDAGFQPLGIEVLSVSGDEAIVLFADVRDEQIIADESGVTVKEFVGWDPELTTVTLHRDSDSRWRFADAEPSVAPSDNELGVLVPVEWTGRTP